MTLGERFWSKVSKTDGDGCWHWAAGLTPKGYGNFNSGKGRSSRAHRVAWELANGPVPTGLLVCHRCDNPSCVRPDHLFLGTDADNMSDKAAKGRGTAPPTWTGADHPRARLTEECVRQLRILAELGIPSTWMAERYGVSRHTAARAAAGRTYPVSR